MEKKRNDGTTEMLRSRIMQWERGRIIFIDDFADVPSQWGVRFGLSALAQEGFIMRLARGVYCYPRIEGEYSMRTIAPEPEAIAFAVAARERVRIQPYGDLAAYELGLSTLRISELRYLTDGAPRRICLSGGRRILFFHTSEVKMFDYCNTTMQKLSSAIRTLGREAIDDERMRKMRSILSNVPQDEFRRDITLPPAWVQEILLDCWNR